MVLSPPTALWVVPVSDPAGVARHVLDVARNGIPGWRLVFLAPPGDLPGRLREMGAFVVEAPFGPDHGLRASITSLRDVVRRERPAVVHSHLSYADIVAALAVGRGPRLVTTEHGIARDDVVYHRSTTKARVMALAHTARLRRFDAAIAVSRATADAMDAKWHPRREVVVIPNGVDLVSRLVPLAPQLAVGGGLRILSLARLAPEKRLALLVDGFAELHRAHPEARLTLAGTGPDELSLRQQVERLGLTKVVTLPGFVDPEEAMAEHDVLAMLSVWENCSYALLDAAASRHGCRGERRRRQPRDPAGPARWSAPDDPNEVASALAAPGPRPGRPARALRLAERGRHVRTDRGDVRRPRDIAMSRIDSPWTLPDQTIDRADEADREIRITDFALMAALPLRSVEVAGYPINEFAMAALVGLCLIRRARGGARLPDLVVILLGALLALLVVSGMANQLDWTRRVGHVAILAGLIWAGGTGRLSLRSVGGGTGDGVDRGHRTRRRRDRRRQLPRPPHRIPRRPQRRRLLHRRAGDPGDLLLRRPLEGAAGRGRADRRRPGAQLLPHRAAGGCLRRWSGCCSDGASARSAAPRWRQVWCGSSTTSPTSLTTFGPFSNRSGSDALRDRIIAQERVAARRRTVVRPRSRHCQGQHPRPRVLLPQQLSRHPPGRRLAGPAPRARTAGLRLPAAHRPGRARRPDRRRRAGGHHRRRRSWRSPSARCCSTPRWPSPWRSPSVRRSIRRRTDSPDG